MNLSALLLAAAVSVCAWVPEDHPVLSAGWEAAGRVAEIAAEAEKPFTVELSFLGDCMLSTYLGQSQPGSFNAYAAAQPPGYFFSQVSGILGADDLTVANLETVLTDRNLTPVEKDHDPAYWFRGPSANAGILTAGGVEAVSLANNHTGDYGAAGRADTVAAVEGAGLSWGGNDRTVYWDKNGFTVAVICHGLWSESQTAQIIPRIEKAAERSDYQIVFYHGGTEGVYQPDPWRVRASRRLADAGADLVVGNHPHVLQPAEVYHGVPIVYSLGNFCYGGSRRPENRTVIYQMRLTVQDGKVLRQEPVIIPCYVYTGKTNNFQPAPITDAAERQRVLDFMAGKAVSPN